MVHSVNNDCNETQSECKRENTLFLEQKSKNKEK